MKDLGADDYRTRHAKLIQFKKGDRFLDFTNWDNKRNLPGIIEIRSDKYYMTDKSRVHYYHTTHGPNWIPAGIATSWVDDGQWSAMPENSELKTINLTTFQQSIFLK